jgi:hypothetical protein
VLIRRLLYYTARSTRPSQCHIESPSFVPYLGQLLPHAFLPHTLPSRSTRCRNHCDDRYVHGRWSCLLSLRNSQPVSTVSLIMTASQQPLSANRRGPAWVRVPWDVPQTPRIPRDTLHAGLQASGGASTCPWGERCLPCRATVTALAGLSQGMRAVRSQTRRTSLAHPGDKDNTPRKWMPGSLPYSFSVCAMPQTRFVTHEAFLSSLRQKASS